jgi:hypothetical protein
MAPFQPAGERARWREIYDLLARTETGGVVTYEAMAEATGLDAEDDRHKIQVAMRRAARELLLIDSRSIEAVPNTGYRVVPTEGKLVLASDYQGKARRAIQRGHDQVTYVDLSGLDEPTVELFRAMAWKFAEQSEAIHRLDVRQRRAESQIKAVTAGQQATADEVAELRERLAKLEAERPQES